MSLVRRGRFDILAKKKKSNSINAKKHTEDVHAKFWEAIERVRHGIAMA